MTDDKKRNTLNMGGNPPDTTGTDFANMSDEDLMNMDISDIFLEDLDKFLAEKRFRASKREMMEERADTLNADAPLEASANEENAAVIAQEAGLSATAGDGAAEIAAPYGAEAGSAAENQLSDAERQTEETGTADAAETADQTAGDTETEDDAENKIEEAEGPEKTGAKEAEAEGSPEAVEAAAEAVESPAEEAVGAAAEAVESPAEEAVGAAAETVEAATAAEAVEGPAAETTENASETASGETPAADEAESAAAAGMTGYAADPSTVGSAASVTAAPVPPVPADPPTTDEPKKKPGIGGLIFVGALLCSAVIAIAAAYFYYADYFSKRFYPGTVINGRDVSVMDPVSVKQDIANEIVTYHLDIKELNDVTETITSEDISLAYIDDGAVDRILQEQNTRLWFIQLLGTKTYDVSTETTYDREKAEQVVNGLACLNPENIVSPQDAQLVDNGTSFSIQPEVEGNELETEKFKEMVFAALDAGETEIDVVANDCYKHPSVRSDDENLNTRMNEYNSILGVNVYYVFGENTEYVNADTLRQFITDDGNHVTLSDDYARKLVYGWGQKYDTFGLSREFTTHSGNVITLPAGGDYGWVINKDVTIADVRDAVATQAAGERTPTFLYSAMGWDNGDITGTYVEVSLSEQKLWCYHNYELVMETDVVTGLPTSDRETKPGIYAIDAKKEDATLGRLDVQGYASPVSFWAPFDGGRGLHDAPWRSSFGGSIYQYDGSHGCVNIPEENMETIFNAIEIGNAVIVY